LKKKIFADLRTAAQRTDVKLDDAGVDALEVVWDVVVPILIGKV